MHRIYKGGIEENTIFEDQAFSFKLFEVHDYTMYAHWHHHIEIIYARKGMSLIGLNDVQVRLDEGDVLIIFGGVVHSIENHKGIYDAFLIGEDLLKDLMYDNDYTMILRRLYHMGDLTHEKISVREEGYAWFRDQIEALKKEFIEKPKGYRMMIKSILSTLLLSIERRLPQKAMLEMKENNKVAYIKKALDYVDQHYTEKITLKDLSRLTHLSEQYFARIFKSYTKKTFIEYLTYYRLERSDWYLKHTDIPITSIPTYIGFCNANYYARTYKEHFHQSPRVTRQNYEKINLN